MGGMDATEDGPNVVVRFLAGVEAPELRSAHGAELSVPTRLGRKALRDLVAHLLGRADDPAKPDLHFLAADGPLRTTLAKFIARHALSTETTLDLTYYLPIPAPKSQAPLQTSPGWLSSVDGRRVTRDGSDAVFALTGSFAGLPAIAVGDDHVVTEESLEHHAHAAPIKAVAWVPFRSSNDAVHSFLSASQDETVRLWSFCPADAEVRVEATFRSDDLGPPVSFESIATSVVSGKYVAALGAFDGSVWVMPDLPEPVAAAEERSERNGKRKHDEDALLAAQRIGDTVQDLCVSSVKWDGADILSAGWDGLARKWDVQACTTKTTIPCGGKAITSISVSDQLLFVSAVDGAVRLVDARDGKGVVAACNKAKAHSGIVSDGTWIVPGRSAASAGVDGSVRVWDARAMTVPAHIIENVHGANGKCISICAVEEQDQQTVLSAGSDGHMARLGLRHV